MTWQILELVIGSRFKGPFFVTTYLVNDKGQKEIVKRKKETRQFDCTVAELIDPRTGKAYKLKRWQRGSAAGAVVSRGGA